MAQGRTARDWTCRASHCRSFFWTARSSFSAVAVVLSAACEASAPADAGRLFVPVSLILHSHCCLDPSLSLLIALANVLLRSCEADALAGGAGLLPASQVLHHDALLSPKVLSLLLLQVVRPIDYQVPEHGASWCHAFYMADAPQMQHCMELQTCCSIALGDAAAPIILVHTSVP